jgi:hypothetical protein
VPAFIATALIDTARTAADLSLSFQAPGATMTGRQSYSSRPRPVDNPLHGVTGDRDVLSTTDQTWLTTDQTSCGSPWSAPAISA